MVRFIGLCFLACVLITSRPALASGQQETADPEEMFARAVQLQQQGDVEDAIREYEGFLKIRPDRADARSNLGAAYARLGRYEDAIAQYQRALTIDATNTAIRFNLAIAFYKAAKFQEAAGEFERVVAAQPENRNATVLLADCDFKIGENKKVVALLQPIEDKGQGDQITAYILGNALINDDQVDKGKIFIDRILRNGDSAEAHTLMGSAYLQINDYQSAMTELRKAVELNPNLQTVHSLFGRALLFSGNPDEARANFEIELKMNPNDFDANLYMGEMLKDQSKYDQALEFLLKAATVRPGNPMPHYYLGCTYLAAGKTDESERELTQVVKDAPDFVEAHVALATLYYRVKRKEDGDRERAIIQKLNAEKQAKEKGASDKLGPGYRGENPKVEKPSTSQEKPLQ